MKDIEFIVDKLKLKGNLFYPNSLKDRNPGILFIHGWTSNKTRSYQYAEALIKLGFIVMVFDMRGHGISEGDINILSPKEFLEDCVAAYDYFSSIDGIDKTNISVVSSSFGGYLSSLLTKKRKIKSLVLRAPADYPNEIFNSSKMKNGATNPEVMKWRNQPKKSNGTFALQAVHDFTGDVLVIESGNDTTIPYPTIQNYIHAVQNRSKLTHIVIKDAPHSIKEGPFKEEVTRILVDWFSKYLTYA